ncbi:hypothetical protein D9M69_570300 [compost metagenome]
MKDTSATAKPPSSTVGRSPTSIRGRAKLGKPCGREPTTFTPWLASRPNAPTSRVAASTAMRMPGTRSKRLSRRMMARVPAPRAKADQFALPSYSAWNRPRVSRSGPALSIEMPNSFGA